MLASLPGSAGDIGRGEAGGARKCDSGGDLLVLEQRVAGTRLPELAWLMKSSGVRSSRVIFSAAYLLVRCLLGCLMVLARREVSKDAELLVVRHEALLSRMEVEDLRLLAVAAVG